MNEAIDERLHHENAGGERGQEHARRPSRTREREERAPDGDASEGRSQATWAMRPRADAREHDIEQDELRDEQRGAGKSRRAREAGVFCRLERAIHHGRIR